MDRQAGIVSVRRSVSSGEIVELGKAARSRRQVPLSSRAREALDLLPLRPDTPLLFPAPGGGVLNLDNWRRRTWAPSIEASGVERPARIYDLRSTFASNALAAGISVFELGRLMGTSVKMIEQHYGAMIEGAAADIARRLDAFEARSGVVVGSRTRPVAPERRNPAGAGPSREAADGIRTHDLLHGKQRRRGRRTTPEDDATTTFARAPSHLPGLAMRDAYRDVWATIGPRGLALGA